MQPITTFAGRTVTLNVANIDTDQVTPAKFTMVTDKLGLGKILFAHWRYSDTEKWIPKPEFPLNKPGAQGATILVTGDNFGCGSSREHAPWAIAGYGFRALISTSFADIFRNNALKNGIIPIIVDAATHKEALDAGEKNLEMSVDLPNQTLMLPSGRTVHFPIDGYAKRCLVKGVDDLGYTLGHEKDISKFEAARG